MLFCEAFQAKAPSTAIDASFIISAVSQATHLSKAARIGCLVRFFFIELRHNPGARWGYRDHLAR
jgi:hypothetical protein